jgi:hypothetical protein
MLEDNPGLAARVATADASGLAAPEPFRERDPEPERFEPRPEPPPEA